VSTASEQPGPGLPEEPAESEFAGSEIVEPSEEASAVSEIPDAAAEDRPEEPETEDERVARERLEFDKLVAAFHSESAPDPQPDRPQSPSPRKIVRYPVLEPRPEWHAEVVEPADETTIDPLDYVEHYEPPDPPLPQVGAATLASWTMLVGGVGFLVLHTLLQWQTPDYFGWLAVIGVFGGIITLVARMKPDRDEYDDPDNGAVV
jgi:hypothetical protein